MAGAHLFGPLRMSHPYIHWRDEKNVRKSPEHSAPRTRDMGRSRRSLCCLTESARSRPPHHSRVHGDSIGVFYAILHGMEFILPAAELLKDLPIRFLIVGGKGKKLADFLHEREVRGLNNISHMAWINFNELPTYIRGASICLGGPFGSSNQAQRVITGKALQFLACESPTVIGNTGETKGIFFDKKNCLLVEPGSAQAIADAIRWAFQHPGDLPEIARQGRKTYTEFYSMDVLTRNLNSFIDSIPLDFS